MQGRFKQLPRGVLYLGGEVLEPTKLGVVSKGLANVLLKFITLWANSRRLSLHCCLDDKEGRQLAHVTMPLWCAADRIVATPEGCAPPQLGTELPETLILECGTIRALVASLAEDGLLMAERRARPEGDSVPLGIAGTVLIESQVQ